MSTSNVLSTTVDGAARITGLSVSTIRRKLEDGELEAKRVGRRILVNYESLERLVSPGSEKAGERA